MRFYFVLVAFLFLCTACGKWIVGPNPPSTPMTNYEALYDHVATHYSFLETKQIDWDSVDQIYRPLIHEKLSDDSLYLILSAMLNTLEDGHVNLYTSTDRSRNHDWYTDYDANFNSNFLLRNYWGKDYQQSGALRHTWLSDSIGYVYYSSFSSRFSSKQLNHVLLRFANAKGLVFDVRDNGGGAMSNIYRLMERFVKEETFMGTIVLKSGPQMDAYSSLDSFVVKPLVDFSKDKEEKKKKKDTTEELDKDTPAPDTVAMYFHKPIALLVNRHSYSATNFFAGFMSQLPNVVLIGDQTGGGGGLPISSELPNGWTYRLSATQVFLPNGRDIEKGILPDIYQSTGPKEEIEGIDAIIERAKTYILDLEES